jgi:hypothetical protein
MIYFRISVYTICGLVGLSCAYAACSPQGLLLTSTTMNNFLRHPEIIVSYDASSSRGARELSVAVTRYAAGGPAVIQAIKSILPSATLQQRMAIGEGLSAAVALCRAIDPTFATQIESAIISIGDNDVVKAARHAANCQFVNLHCTNKKFELVSTAPSAHARGLIGQASPSNPGRLKLSDPFGSPDAWQ